MSRKQQIKNLDKKFAILVKLKSNLTCQKCGKIFPIEDGKIPELLDASHFIKRRFMLTRWSDKNVFAHCRDCHDFLENNREAFEHWVVTEKIMTPEEIMTTRQRATQIWKGYLDPIEAEIDKQLVRLLPAFGVLKDDVLVEIYGRIAI